MYAESEIAMNENFFHWIKSTTTQSERKIAMVRHRLNGETYKAIGLLFGVSASRVNTVFHMFERLHRRYIQLHPDMSQYEPLPFDELIL